MSSKTTSSSKGSDDKAIVSFSSDTDDESTSSSSRLSSSAESSEEESGVETVTFAVPLPKPGQGNAKGAAERKPDNKTPTTSTKTSEIVKDVELKKSADEVLKISGEKMAGKSGKNAELVSVRDRSSVKETGNKETGKASGKLEDRSDDVKVARTKAQAVASERPRSPKIVINEVEETPATNDIIVTKKTAKKDSSISAKKTSSNEEAEKISAEDLGLGKRVISSRSADAEVELKESTKRSAKLKEKDDSPRSTSRDGASGEVATIKTSKIGEDIDSEITKPSKKISKSSRTASDENEPDRVKSLKKDSEGKEIQRVKSPKILLEDVEIEEPKTTKKAQETRTPKSPKVNLDEKETEVENSLKRTSDERDKSPKGSTKESGEAKKKSSKETPYELLRGVESPEKSPTRTLKSKKSSANEEVSKSDDLDTVVTGKTKTKTSKKTANNLLSEDKRAKEEGNLKTEPEDNDTKKTTDIQDNDAKKKSKKIDDILREPSPRKEKKDSGEVAAKTDSLELSKIKPTNLSRLDEPEPTGENDAAVKDTSSKMKDDLIAAEKETVPEKDYMKVIDGTGSKPELENEESEFTYRRKSMDDFIKRILAEAREERLKQKQGQSNDTTVGDDRKQHTTAERNGELPEDVLDKQKWNGNKTKEISNLDRRLANIEKRRFGGSESGKGENETPATAVKPKGGKDLEEDGTTNKVKSVKNDAKGDVDVNLDEDLEEINRFLQSRKSAASRFDFDEAELNNDTGSSAGKRRWVTDKEPQQQQQQQQPEDDESIPLPGNKTQVRKKYSADLDLNDDEEQFLAKFRRDAGVPEDSFVPRRRNETGEIVRERTRNVRVLVDQQVEIVQAMRSTSKNLDELEKEIREVRQVCLDRQARIEALEGALSAEYRAYENDKMAASDRQQQNTDEFGLPMGRLRKQEKFKSESLDEENFPFRRRSGSVASTTSFSSGFAPGRNSDASNDLSDLRPSSALRPPKGPEFGNELESRRRGGSVLSDRNGDALSFGLPDDPGFLLSQRPARSRASIATSNPTIDFAGIASGDSFLAKIRAKYSFLAPSLGAGDRSSYAGSSRTHGLGSSSINDSFAYDSKYGRRSGLESTRSNVRDILTSGPPYGSLVGIGSYSTGRYSTRDSHSPSYGSGGFISSSSANEMSAARMRRAQSVTDVTFERPTVASTHTAGSGSSAFTSGEFHSRFLDKVRGKKAMGEENPTSKTTQEKPFRSRFLKTTSFDASNSRPDRQFSSSGDGATSGADTSGKTEVNGNA